MADPPGSKEPQLSWLPTYDPMSVGLGYMPEEDIQTAHAMQPFISEAGKDQILGSLPFGVGTAYGWNDMGPWGRAASIGFDIADFLTIPGTMSPWRSGFNQFAKNWSPSMRNPFGQTPDTSFVRFGKLPGDDIQQAFGPTQPKYGVDSYDYTTYKKPYKPKPTIGQAYPQMGQELPIPKKGFDYSANWGQQGDPLLPDYLYEKGISSYQMIPYKDRLNPATKWLVRNPQTLDPADPNLANAIFDPRYGDAEVFQRQFSSMGRIKDSSQSFGLDNRGTYAITGKPVSSLGADFEQLIDPTQVSSYQRIPHESLTFASPEFSKEMFKGFDTFGNPIGNRPLSSIADSNLSATPFTMPHRVNIAQQPIMSDLEETFQQRKIRGKRGRGAGDTGG